VPTALRDGEAVGLDVIDAAADYEVVD